MPLATLTIPDDMSISSQFRAQISALRNHVSIRSKTIAVSLFVLHSPMSFLTCSAVRIGKGYFAIVGIVNVGIFGMYFSLY